jgi:hypothetical protein
LAFVTNQELTLGEREQLRTLAGSTAVDLYHLERITTILDLLDMANVRQQFFDIEPEGNPPLIIGGLGGSAQAAEGVSLSARMRVADREGRAETSSR